MAKAEYRSSLRSKRLIYEALAEALQEKPLEKITVTELVRRADINRGTFYAHFTDIPDVINHILDQYFERISSAFRPGLPVEQWPNVLVRQLQTIFEEDSTLTMKLAASPASTYIEQRLCKLMLDYLMVYKSQFPQLSHDEFELRLRFCARGLAGMYHDWYSSGSKMSLQELSEKAVHLLYIVVDDLQNKASG